MVLRLSERRQAILFGAILILSIASLYAATQTIRPAPVEAYVVHLLQLDIEAGDWSIHYSPIATANNTAFALLLEASMRLGFSVAYVPYQIPQGVFVTAINGSANGEGGRFWQYWVNGAYGDVAADHQALQDNDIVLWTFASSQEGA